MSDSIQLGIYFDMPESVYRAAPGLCQTDFKVFIESPALYRRGVRREQTDAMSFGSAFDCWLLDRKRFDGYAVKPDGHDGRTVAGKAWAANNAGKKLLTRDEYERIKSMDAAVWAHQTAAGLLAKAKYQVSVFGVYQVGDTSIPIKGRFDVLPSFHDAIIDVKTTRDASPQAFAKDVYSYGYHIQAAFYRHLYNSINGTEDPRQNFGFIAVQDDAFVDHAGEVYGVEVFSVRPDVLELADEIIERHMRRFKTCQELNKWPGVEQTLQWIEIPHWAEKAERQLLDSAA